MPPAIYATDMGNAFIFRASCDICHEKSDHSEIRKNYRVHRVNEQVPGTFLIFETSHGGTANTKEVPDSVHSVSL